MRAIFAGCLCVVVLCGAALANQFSALARVDMDRSAASDTRGGAEITLGLSQPVPFRIYTLHGPNRLVVEMSEVAWAGFQIEEMQSKRLPIVQVGTLAPGWSGLVYSLSEPLAVETAQMRTDPGQAGLHIRLAKVSEAEFAATAGLPEGAAAYAVTAAPKRAADRAPLVVIDPGHGGVDPGAEYDGVRESDLMLRMARELRDALRRQGIEAQLTRDADVFVALPARPALARSLGADAFVSLHADALKEGYAEGATVHTLAPEARDNASILLAERLDRADILTGVDLAGQDDQIATILLDLARQDTTPRSQRLALSIIDGLVDAGARTNRRANREADFAVLRSADVPSVLVEVGFLSSKRDRIELQSPEKRGRIVEGLAQGIQTWLMVDDSERALNRQ